MRQLRIGNRVLTDEDVFVIAEIGSNHGGDLELCHKMIVEAARCGVDAVKLQKRDNDALFTKTMLEKPYNNEFSCGKTYGEHRKKLDWFGKTEFESCQRLAHYHGVLFFATPFDEPSVDFLANLGVPLWKIASCDVTNLPLVRKIAKYCDPMIISLGGATMEEIERLYGEIQSHNDNFALLHCVSTYPNEDSQLNLNFIETLRRNFSENLIGFSSHHPGIEPLIIARNLGASIFEVHFTLNRGSRGTDHGFSIEPHGLETLCKDLKRVNVMLGASERVVYPEERTGFIKKMGKGLYLNKPLQSGSVINVTDITIKAPAGGFTPAEIDKVVGHSLISECSTGVCLNSEVIR